MNIDKLWNAVMAINLVTAPRKGFTFSRHCFHAVTKV